MPASSVRNENDDVRSVAETDHSSMVRVEVRSNADLYATNTPPAYTMSVAEDEQTLDAEAYRPEKSEAPASPNQPSSPTVEAMHPIARAESQAGPSTVAQPPPPSDLPPDYFTELTNNAAAAHTKRCSVLKERPATWLVKRKNIALCPLVATVLVKEQLLRSKDLELLVSSTSPDEHTPSDNERVSRSSGVKRDPTDPLSAVAFGVYDTVGDILLGLVQGPVELGKQVAPIMEKYEAKQTQGLSPYDPHWAPSQPSATRPATSHSYNSSIQQDPAKLGSAHNLEKGDAASTKSAGKSALAMAPNAAKQVAIGTGKGLGKIVGAGLKAPMTFSHGITRGFHNVPKMYGEEVREYENVVDLRSGLMVSAKGLGHGISDGILDFFVKPIEGARKEGVKGFGKGFGKGVGNLVCKPAAGAFGVVGYSSVGVYKQLQSIGSGRKNSAEEVVMSLGEAEYDLANDNVRLEIVKIWCCLMMRHK